MRDGLFLYGGGDLKPEGGINVAGPFLKAAGADKGKKILLILAQEGEEDVLPRYAEMLEKAGCPGTALEPLILRYGEKPDAGLNIPGLGGVFVGGGLTPLYGEILCGNETFRRFVTESNMPYAGFSAGAAIAAETAITGGYLIRHKGIRMPVLHEDSSEELDYISEIRGLGLFPLPLDVHASYWGNATRALFFARESGTPVLAIDESTMIWTEEGRARVSGNGFVYGFYPSGKKNYRLRLYEDGETIEI